MELIENKAKLTGDMEKEKQNLIVKFENTFKKKNSQIDAEIIKELFPEDEELYNRVKKMTDKMYKTGISFKKSNINDTNRSKSKSRRQSRKQSRKQSKDKDEKKNND